MTALIFSKAGRVILAAFDNPPVNALSHSVRSGLMDAIERLREDDAADALVILCRGKEFFSGADIREFGAPMREPRLGEVIASLDAAAKPIVAAIHGTALGGGLEVALACNYRVSLASTRFGMPEVKLGILPGAGGVSRLPRLVGAALALEMIGEGRQIDATRALEAGLMDAVFERDLEENAVAFAAGCSGQKAALPRAGERSFPPMDQAFIENARSSFAKKYRGFNAPMVAIDLFQMAATTGFAEASQREAETCRALLATPESRALRHLFSAERAVSKVADLQGCEPREVREVVVVGPGVMGRGIAQCCIDAGARVTLIGRTEQDAQAGVAAIGKTYEAMVARGTLNAALASERLSRLVPTVSYSGLQSADLAIEAVTEDLNTKREVLDHIEEAVGPQAIVATNTSFLDFEKLGSGRRYLQNFIGMHFFNPAPVMKLVEIVRGRQSSPTALATAMRFAKTLGKTAVIVGPAEGFVANRMLSRRTREAQFLIEEGATPWQVDKVLVDFGFPIGPFALADLAGIDVMAATRATRMPGMTKREQQCDLLDRLLHAGRLGQKSRAGYYAYDEKRKGSPAPEVEAIIAQHRLERGFQARVIDDEEILERCLYAVINEGAKILDEGGAAKPSDIDVIWTTGLAFPRYRGGPLFYADEMGLGNMLTALAHYSESVGRDYFKPASRIVNLVGEGRGFYA